MKIIKIYAKNYGKNFLISCNLWEGLFLQFSVFVFISQFFIRFFLNLNLNVYFFNEIFPFFLISFFHYFNFYLIFKEIQKNFFFNF